MFLNNFWIFTGIWKYLSMYKYTGVYIYIYICIDYYKFGPISTFIFLPCIHPMSMFALDSERRCGSKHIYNKKHVSYILCFVGISWKCVINTTCNKQTHLLYIAYWILLIAFAWTYVHQGQSISNQEAANRQYITGNLDYHMCL